MGQSEPVWPDQRTGEVKRSPAYSPREVGTWYRWLNCKSPLPAKRAFFSSRRLTLHAHTCAPHLRNSCKTLPTKELTKFPLTSRASPLKIAWPLLCPATKHSGSLRKHAV